MADISEAMVEAFKAKYREFWPRAWPSDTLLSKAIHEVLRASIDAALSAAPASAQMEGWQPTHRHKKRGSTYRVIAESRLQVDGDLDNEKVVIYQGEDGQIWVRVAYEFNDGRFETLPTAPPPTSEGSSNG